jgi:hypothetical protein
VGLSGFIPSHPPDWRRLQQFGFGWRRFRAFQFWQLTDFGNLTSLTTPPPPPLTRVLKDLHCRSQIGVDISVPTSCSFVSFVVEVLLLFHSQTVRAYFTFCSLFCQRQKISNPLRQKMQPFEPRHGSKPARPERRMICSLILCAI